MRLFLLIYVFWTASHPFHGDLSLTSTCVEETRTLRHLRHPNHRPQRPLCAVVPANDDYLWIREKTIRKSKDVTRQKNKPFRVDLDLGGGDTFSFADMLSVVGTTRASSDGVSAGCLAGELCCESEPALLLVVVFEGEACSFSARRLLLLPCTIATKASLGVLSLGILVTAG